jgi:hypothetical protein
MTMTGLLDPGGPGGGSPGTIWGSPSFELPDPTAPIQDRDGDGRNDFTQGGFTELRARLSNNITTLAVIGVAALLIREVI